MTEAKTDTFKDVVVGVYNFSLSHEGRYQGLLSPELVNFKESGAWTTLA
jgi:hypothetical protein